MCKDKGIVAYPHNRMVHSSENEQIVIQNNWKNLTNNIKGKTQYKKDNMNILFEFIYINFKIRQN